MSLLWISEWITHVGLDQPLNLSPSVLGGILQCTITRWDDPAIRAINPQARCKSSGRSCSACNACAAQ